MFYQNTVMKQTKNNKYVNSGNIENIENKN